VECSVKYPDHDPDLDIEFAIWRDGEPEEEARVYSDRSAADAVTWRARHDYHQGYEGSWPVVYRARDKSTGEEFAVEIGMELRPHFSAVRVDVVPMPPAVHILWGDRAICENPQLRGEPGGWSWPEDQTWITLSDFADGDVAGDRDRCAACWKRAPGLVVGLRQIGATK
jgi:hypothetical protein